MPVLSGVFLAASKVEDRKRVHNFSDFVLATTLVLVVISNCVNFGKSCSILSLPMGLELTFRIDWFAALFSTLFSLIWMLVGVYTRDYLRHEGKDRRFMSFYFIALGCLNAVAYAANPFTFYTAFEGMSLTSFALVLHSQTKESIAAAKKYIYYSIFGALCGLIGIMSFYGSDLVKVKEFVAGGSLVHELGGRMPLVAAVTFIAIIGFSCKAGMFPMHAWLPVAHPEAPAPASAVLSGLIAKTGVIAIIRIVYFVVGPDVLRGSWVQYALLILSIATIFMGSMMAFKENLLKRRLAYSSVSQIAYALFGVFMLSKMGLRGALLQMVFHAFAKTILFLCAGAVIHQTGFTKVSQLNGLGKSMHKSFACFTVAALSLVGVPLTGGFESKLCLARSALNGNFGTIEFVGFIVIMISALLTGGYLLSITAKVLFAERKDEIADVKDASRQMLIPLNILTALIVVFGIWPEPVKYVIEHVIASMII